MVPLFFVVLGARIDRRGLGQHPSLIVLAALLVAFNAAVHVLAALLTRQPLPAGLAATAQLGVPAAVAPLALQLHVLAGQRAASPDRLMSLEPARSRVEMERATRG